MPGPKREFADRRVPLFSPLVTCHSSLLLGHGIVGRSGDFPQSLAGYFRNCFGAVIGDLDHIEVSGENQVLAGGGVNIATQTFARDHLMASLLSPSALYLC